MKIKFVGGRSRVEISYNRKSYHFTPENNRILDIQEKEVINYIFGLPNRAEFEVVIEPPKPEEKYLQPEAPVKIIGKPLSPLKIKKGGKSDAKKKR